MGALNRVSAEVREIFRKAIINSSKSIILVHNHPSGIPLPFEQDKELHEQVSRDGKFLGIQVRDTVIIGRYGYFSFFEDIEKLMEYSGQMGLFVEQEITCVRCGEWVIKDNAAEWNSLSYCVYCWEICFGEMDEDLLLEVD